MSEYRMCVTSGYPFRWHTSYEAEAIVYTFGGCVAARFVVSGPGCRAKARYRANAWLAADPKLRAKMQARERSLGTTRAAFWNRVNAA